jgi:hypothetical protein
MTRYEIQRATTAALNARAEALNAIYATSGKLSQALYTESDAIDAELEARATVALPTEAERRSEQLVDQHTAAQFGWHRGA